MIDRQVWLTPRALKLHAVILVVVPGFMALCIWQLYRALDGNELSWAYVFEWPFFAAYAVYMWWRFVHEVPDASVSAKTTTTAPAASGVSDERGTAEPHPGLEQGPEPAPAAREAAADEAEAEADAELEAYNEYLAQLAARDKAAGR